MMVLTGSRAATLRGCLPTWRQGRMVDHDFYAGADEREAFLTKLAAEGAHLERQDTARSVTAIVNRSEMISIMAPDAVCAAILRCDDNRPMTHLGWPVLVISERTQLALKQGYIDRCAIHRRKNLADIAFWAARVSLEPQHLNVCAAMAEAATDIWPQSQPKGIPCPTPS